MGQEDWRQIKEVFQTALGIAPAAARDAYLDEACDGEPGLRAEVESLLDAYADANADDFLTRAGVPVNRSHGPGPTREVGASHIGAYRIESRLGRGGMGHVYLGIRDDGEFSKRVAIKVIRASRATPAIIQRFRAERQILADAEHPNIARLLDGGTTDDGLPYFIMEYIEGRPIDEYCDAERLSIDERLDLFLRVCRAVHFAHTHQIVHRDLKPGNILVSADGAPKLLDFGIAKLMATTSDTPTVEPTAVGEFLLTPSYASPEQVRGGLITSASDVYSLGVLLYVLLSGNKPYDVDPSSDYARIISESEPRAPSVLLAELLRHAEEGLATDVDPERIAAHRRDSLASIQTQLEGNLDLITLGALRKSPADRYASVEALAKDIERHLGGGTATGPRDRAAAHHVTGPASPGRQPQPAPRSLLGRAPASRVSGLGRILANTQYWLLPVVAVVGLLWLTSLWLARETPPLNPAGVSIEANFTTPEGVSFTAGDRNVAAVSADGRSIIYVGTETDGTTGLWLRPLGNDAGTAKIPGTQGAMYPFWLSDGISVGFFARGELRSVGIDGSNGVVLSQASMEGRGGTANRDGVVIYAPDRGEGLFRVGPGDGPELVSRPDPDEGESAHVWPQFFPPPHDDRFLYFVSSRDPAVRGIYVGWLDDEAPPRRLMGAASNGAFASGYLLYVRDGSLMARPMDPDTLQFQGEERTIVTAVSVTRDAQSAFSASDNGVLAYESPAMRELRWLDGDGDPLDEIAPRGSLWNPALSADGTLAAIESYAEGSSEILVFDLERMGSRLSISIDGAMTRHPVWAKRHPTMPLERPTIAYSAESVDGFALYARQLYTGVDDAVELFSSAAEKLVNDWSPDGRYLLFAERPPGENWDLLALDLEAGDTDPLRLAATDASEHSGRFSPTGMLIAFAARHSGINQIYVQRFETVRRMAQSPAPQSAASAEACMASIDGGYDPRWGRNDGELYYLARNGTLMRVSVGMERGCNIGAPEPLFDSGVDTPGTSRNHYAVEHGTDRFLFNRPVSTRNPFNVLTNWPERRR